jgi:hypothetical protein
LDIEEQGDPPVGELDHVPSRSKARYRATRAP